MTELISQGAIIAIVGYALVFVVLSTIWGLLELSKVFFLKKANTKKEEPEKAPANPLPSASAGIAQEEDEEELIAVLTAAVAASMGRTSTYNLNIKSYRRVGSNSPAWNKISRQENLS